MDTCPTCGSEHETERAVKLHHFHKHGERIGVNKVDCEVCGETVERYDSQIEDRDNIFCSVDCQATWQSENQSGEAHWQYNRVERECKQCGETFEEVPSRIENGRGKYCSRECYGQWLSENNSGKSHHQAQKITVECDSCSEQIHLSPSRVTERNFCDGDCMAEWYQEYIPAGEDHFNYEGGVVDYGKGWNERKKQSVRERDGYECQSCGMAQDQHMDKYDVKLSVHHITPARAYADEEKRNSMDNLITLCIPCHRHWEQMAPLKPT